MRLEADARLDAAMSGSLRVLFDYIFPASCEACDRSLPPGHPSCLCAPCMAAMTPPPQPWCMQCGVPLPAHAASSSCFSCFRHPPAFASARAAALYLPGTAGASPLSTAVQRLKYGGRRIVARALGELLAERYPFSGDALVVPVPLHPGRLRARGFNQAVLLARVLARERGLSMAPRALVRTRATRAQPGLPATERRRNLEAAFVVSSPHEVVGRHVVLLDDVLTTGATADACARALAVAGAPRVDVYTVGRAP